MAGSLGRFLLIAGAVIVAAGLLLLLADRLGIGRLPGDFAWRGDGWTVYVPLGWMIVLSVLLTLLLNIFLRR